MPIVSHVTLTMFVGVECTGVDVDVRVELLKGENAKAESDFKQVVRLDSIPEDAECSFYASYIWDQKASERGEDKPVKQHDHAMDALRYFCYTIIRKSGSIGILK